MEIKTEADSNECPHDDKPSTGMFAVSDDILSALSSQFDDQKSRLRWFVLIVLCLRLPYLVDV